PDLSAFSTGSYTTQDEDDRLWAAAELWETTGDAGVLAELEPQVKVGVVVSEWDWSNVENLGYFTYLLSERTGKDPATVASVRKSAVAAADGMVTSAANHGYGRALGPHYNWGINGTTARSVMNLEVAYRINPDPRYLDTAVLQIDHLLGRNYYGRSFVTGI